MVRSAGRSRAVLWQAAWSRTMLLWGMGAALPMPYLRDLAPRDLTVWNFSFCT
jgi:hypothetical protein